mmetsp:Transcript_41487/g.74415  ORF Transcript_41487/g.74415 Transcript_41487/m.74415 type:complete len:256 (-) Transcript_41487:256-1023(-)
MCPSSPPSCSWQCKNPSCTKLPAAKRTREVALSLYRMTNSTLFRVGARIYHSAVEVCGREWQYGGSDLASDDFAHLRSGVFWDKPGESFKDEFLERLVLGQSKLCKHEIQQLTLSLSQSVEWRMDKYDPLTHNCNHFSEYVCRQLNPEFVFPAWINRLASWGQKIIPKPLRRTVMIQSQSSVFIPPANVTPEELRLRAQMDAMRYMPTCEPPPGSYTDVHGVTQAPPDPRVCDREQLQEWSAQVAAAESSRYKCS